MKTHRTFRKALSVLLILAMLVPLLCAPAYAETPDSGDDYTTVFVHGLLGWGSEDGLNSILPYWGLTSGNMVKYMQSMGYDVYVATVGPLSSAWDRCCELFAQLTGSRVDYGQAHAARCTEEYASLGYSLRHERYGRDYTGRPAVEGWGPIYEDGDVVGWYDNKLNLVGHSFGGPTVLSFLHLLAEGDEAERAWGMAQAEANGGDWHDYVSPLFWGDYDGEYLINSVTSLAGVLNGTTFISANSDEMKVLTDLALFLANSTGITHICSLYDFQLEQFGLTNIPGSDPSACFSFLKQKGFNAGKDQAWYDLSTQGCNELKKSWQTYNNVYYLSYTGDKTYKTVLTGAHLPRLDMMITIMIFSAKMGLYVNTDELIGNVDGSIGGCADKSWQPNDGMVNTVSAMYPFGTAHKSYDPANIEAGMWNVHPTLTLDHIEFVGGLLNGSPSETKKLYRGIMSDIANTVPIFPELSASCEPEPGEPAVFEEPEDRLDTPAIYYSGKTLLGFPVFNWNTVLGAASYEISRAEGDDGEFEKLGVSLLSCYTDLSARPGTVYRYRVTAVPLTDYASESLPSEEARIRTGGR